jgi:tRNA pseudouridine32 synthase/23S rRNA pseudouridine746 synthase
MNTRLRDEERSSTTRLVLKETVPPGESGTVCDFLAAHSGLSKGKIKKAMNCGAVWLKRKNGKRLRIRRATAPVRHGDMLELYYDQRLLCLNPPQARCVSDRTHYSVWYKPAGLFTQGTNYGDHCCLLRQAEQFFASKRQVFLVHRLDREASGLVLLAHSRVAASRFSGLFHHNRIEKHYRIEVLGDLAGKKSTGTIDLPLAGKSALTRFEAVSYNPRTNTSYVNVVIETGRLHQIRRHFHMIGFPVMGDPRYGRGNKNTTGLRLEAVCLKFVCPFSNEELVFALHD